ncbi:MAG TPA: redox-regulated ATPase YchF [Candidatus Babeliales bacterium]|nr:redox-regulated ATPase YchF [Candidatus Babeliales bacterium]
MSIKAGLVGLPNVGKSTLFNALTKSSVPAENYPFCTIEPHLAITEVPDERTAKLKALYQSQSIIPATVSFVDIAGLVKGAASGEGLGNQFLSHIREVDLILHVLRCFTDPDIIYSGAELNPLEDYEIIMTELMLKDAETVQKREEKVAHLMKGAKNKPAELKELNLEQETLAKIKIALDALNIEGVRTALKEHPLNTISLLSAKNFLIIANVSEGELEDDGYKNNVHYKSLVARFGQNRVIPICAKLESELISLSDAEAQEMMGMLGVKERGLATIIQKTYEHLGLITFFTCGPKEIHSWPVKKGLTVRQASGEIHSDLERGFICAEVFNCADLFAAGSIAKLKEQGKMRTEGQDYLVRDGDIVLVKFNV